MDKDKNGLLNTREQKNIRRVVRKNEMKLNGVKKCVRKFFEEICDLNQDNAVDAKEFSQCVLIKEKDSS